MAPLHRLERKAHQHNPAHGAGEKGWDATGPRPSRGRQLVDFVIRWIKVSWKDIIAMALLGGAALGIYQVPLASTRNFPITFDRSGDIVYPEFAYPDRGWIISPALSGILGAFVPIGVILLAQVRIRSFWDTNNAILGLLYSLILSSLFQVVMKMLVGGFRPYFLTVCQPDISRVKTSNATGLNAVGFHQIMYTVDVCTNPDRQALKTAMTSFPSGHSTTAFAGYVFLFLWMNAKLKVWSNHQASFYWLALLMAPLLGAVLMACALSINQDHHWYDILAGAAIGTFMAFCSYRACYAAVWDWRYNHIPLTRTDALDYTTTLTPRYMERAVFVRKLGWGRRRRNHTARKGATGSWSEGSVVNGGDSGGPYAQQAQTLRHPDPAMAGGGAARRQIAGDEMV